MTTGLNLIHHSGRWFLVSTEPGRARVISL